LRPLKRNLHIEDTANAVLFRTQYKRANRGFQSRVAKQLHVSRAMVGMVFNGEKRSARVEAALRRIGALWVPKRRFAA